MAILPKAYPDGKFKGDEVALLRRSIKGSILDLVRGTKAPIFQGTSESDGAAISKCIDEDIVEWLKSLTNVLPIKGGGALAACAGDRWAAKAPSNRGALGGP
jgi:hypothetical protein